MAAISQETLFDLLATNDIAGGDAEREALRTRIGELLELNGADWIRENRGMLLEQWRCIVEMKFIRTL
ncbi:MAG: hypothetical protein MUD16_13730 [Desulfobacterales bacterium]|jgi:hypothetical protein|nr:hypothetical protein [Desulfobacterales bacterium]